MSEFFDPKRLNVGSASVTTIEHLLTEATKARQALNAQLDAINAGELLVSRKIRELNESHDAESLGVRAVSVLGNFVSGRPQFDESIRVIETDLANLSKSAVSLSSEIQLVEDLISRTERFLSTAAAKKWKRSPESTIRQLETVGTGKKHPRNPNSTAKKAKENSGARQKTALPRGAAVDAVRQFRETLGSSCGPVSREIMLRANGDSGNVAHMHVTEGREFLIRSYEAMESLDNRLCAKNFQLALDALARGVTEPCAAEWPIDGPQFGAAQSLVWYGIAKSISGMPPSEEFMPVKSELQSPDGCFASASFIFWELGHPQELARALQEWAEHRRDWSDRNGAFTLYTVASAFFRIADNALRADIAQHRAQFKEPELGTIRFFDRKQPHIGTTGDHSTILGSHQSKRLELALSAYMSKSS